MIVIVSTAVTLEAEVVIEREEAEAIKGVDVLPLVTLLIHPPLPGGVVSITKRVSVRKVAPVIERRRAGNLSRRMRSEKCRLA